MESVVVAAPAGHEDRCAELLEAVAASLSSTVVTGGRTRADSVGAAIAAVETELVLIHDAARPLVGSAAFDALVRRLDAEPEAGAAVLAAPIVDTVKRSLQPHDVSPGWVAETVPRRTLWAAQTPQAFRADALRAAQAAAAETGELGSATDEAWLIERAGGRILLEPTDGQNIKVTGPGDLEVAAALLQRRSST